MMELVRVLCRANQEILNQKLGLLKALASKHGVKQSQVVYKQTCPVLKASIGQHIRHSMDHMERAFTVATSLHEEEQIQIHYDLRERGHADEYDMSEAKNRILRVDRILQELIKYPQDVSLASRSIEAGFMLSGDSEMEYMLPSSIARELGFTAHHAIHHLAMVRIIATSNHIGGLSDSDLPSNFGRAPSTANHDRNVASD